VAKNVKLFVVKVAKCKQSSILTSIKNTLNFTDCQKAKDENDGSDN
jgi:hypothetical protein